jgi:2OG-Fe(II) oxygenase superfamily
LVGSPWINLDKFTAADVAALGAAYRQAAPFPHLVIDDLFSPAVLRGITAEFNNTPPDWREFRGTLQYKRATLPGTQLPHTVQNYFNFLYSGPFLRFLSRITGIDNLIPDPDLHGGGMHEVPAGGRFEVHTDFATHPQTGLTNRLAVITYLNEDWCAEDGGALELWDLHPPRCRSTVLPSFARTIIMEQSARSAHGHPSPVRQGRTRRSVIAYFYTAGTAAKAASDMLATTYLPHEAYSPHQRAEHYLRRVTPRFLVRTLKAIDHAVRPRR